MTPALQGWHPGEVALQHKLGYVDAISTAFFTLQIFLSFLSLPSMIMGGPGGR
jgi:hypothetical protein